MLCECAGHDCGLDVPRAQLVGDTPECPKARLLRRVDTLGCPRVVRVLSVLSARLLRRVDTLGCPRVVRVLSVLSARLLRRVDTLGCPRVVNAPLRRVDTPACPQCCSGRRSVPNCPTSP